jgi:hypothetical protein
VLAPLVAIDEQGQPMIALDGGPPVAALSTVAMALPDVGRSAAVVFVADRPLIHGQVREGGPIGLGGRVGACWSTASAWRSPAAARSF